MVERKRPGQIKSSAASEVLNAFFLKDWWEPVAVKKQEPLKIYTLPILKSILIPEQTDARGFGDSWKSS